MSFRKFYRSSTDRKLAGIFGGLGEAFDIDPAYLRLAFVLLAVVTGVIPALIGYAVGWLVTQEAPSASVPGEASNARTSPGGETGEASGWGAGPAA